MIHASITIFLDELDGVLWTDENAKHHGKCSQLRRLASGISGIVWSGHYCVVVILSGSYVFEWTDEINQLRTSVSVVPIHTFSCPHTTNTIARLLHLGRDGSF